MGWFSSWNCVNSVEHCIYCGFVCIVGIILLDLFLALGDFVCGFCYGCVFSCLCLGLIVASFCLRFAVLVCCIRYYGGVCWLVRVGWAFYKLLLCFWWV